MSNDAKRARRKFVRSRPLHQPISGWPPVCIPTVPRRGTVLVVTMWITLVLAGLVLVFGRSIRVEVLTSANQLAAAQAEAVARGGLAFLLALVDGTDGTRRPGTDVSCEAVPVGDGYFWLLCPDPEDDRSWHFGISDEAGKVNLNSATPEMLLKLPSMTDELAAAVVDWRSPDPTSSAGGAKSEYYLLLPEPYQCKSGPLETIEEILLVKGASLDILFGEDVNRNGVLDTNEDDAAATPPSDNRDGRLDRGLYDFVTIYSAEPNTDSAGRPRININSTDTGELTDLLRSVVAPARLFSVLDNVRRGRPFRNILDFYFRTGLTMDEFRQIADRLTTSRERMRVGLVNVATAPRQVLRCLPGLDETDAEALLARRAASDTDLSNIAWVAEVLPAEKATAIGDRITVRSFQFSADIVAVSGDGRAFRRYRAVVDARSSPPRVVSWQDLTTLGWPLAKEILSSLRAGNPPPVTGVALRLGGS